MKLNTLFAGLWLLGFTAVYASEPPPDHDRSTQMERARAELDQARQELQRAAKEFARLATEHGRASPAALAYAFAVDPDRAVLGVIIGPLPVDHDVQRGILVKAVTPGSGAEKAGLRAGDVLLSANAESLEVVRDAQPGPVERLHEVMRGLSPGDRVEIVYQRDGRRSKTTVEATRAGMPDWGALPGMVPDPSWLEGLKGLEGMVPPLPPMPPLLPWALHHGLQLAALDPDLADYFGTAEGVLVVRAPADNPLQLKSGDVLQSVNGQAVADPRQAWEALQAARGDATLELQVVRQGRPLTVQGQVPRRKGRRGP